MSQFIGRESELAQLKEIIMLEKSAICVVYGRRRVGKSELIREATKGARVIFIEGLENQSKQAQISNFLGQLKLQCRADLSNPNPSTWREALLNLLPFVQDDPERRGSVIVFDEFQWLANYRHELVSDLKMVWEQYLSRQGKVTLILCGSVASFMISKVIKSSALYGRTDSIIHLQPFKLEDTARLLSNRCADEVLEAQMLVGGIPKYLELLSSFPSVRLAMQQLGFTADGYFVEEYQRIFVSHFGKQALYRKVIEVLASHPYGLERKQLLRLSKAKEGGSFTKVLENLEAAGFVYSFRPLDCPENSKLQRFSVRDPYLKLYFSFIKPNLKKIKTASKDLFLQLMQTSSYLGWRGVAFENLCYDHAHAIAGMLGFSGIEYSFGPFYRRGEGLQAGVQIDLAFDRADNVISLCEMKYTEAPVGVEVIQHVQKKVEHLSSFSRKTIQKVLITKSPATKELQQRGYFYKIISAESLIAGRQGLSPKPLG